TLRISDPHGLIEVDVPAGQHRLDVRMEATPVRRLGTAISWGALLVMLGLFWWARRKNQTG
ncbi:MAG: GlyGly-CTERM sorting domain-containing protein, partial [Caldilineaceae bacterium]|nr:GlyGly-CTERM sorting domain-containing protein [Caldilineaceae bacterium]